MTAENLLIAIVAALIGGICAHRMTISLLKERTKSLEDAFYTEFDIILNNFKNYITNPIDEYKNPLRDEYTEPPAHSLDLIESIVIELAGTTKIITPHQRRFISWIKTTMQNLGKNESKRDPYIEKWIINGESLDAYEKRETLNNIKMMTAERLFAIIQLIFGIEKFLKEKRNFTSVENEHYIDYAKTVCSSCNITFDEEFWKDIIKKITGR